MSKYVTFEISKLLKEKGFNLMPFYIQSKTDYVLGYDYDIEDEEDNLKIREFQWEDHICSHLYLMPVYFDVVDWLLEKHGIWISVKVIKWNYEKDIIRYNYNICKLNLNNPSNIIDSEYNFETPKEAYLSAIEYTLKNLIYE